MRALLLTLLLLSVPAAAQSGDYYSPPTATLIGAATTAGANTFLSAQTFSASLRTTAGQKLTFDGATEAKYLSSDGTTLALTGLNFRTPKIGIGTDPSYPLHIAGASAGGVMFGITGTSMTTSDLGFYIGGPTLTGSLEIARLSATLTSYLEFNLQNGNSSNANAHARFQVQSTGASGGDPYYAMTISGVDNWAMGIDNSDSDKWKVSRSSVLGTNDLVAVTTAGAMDVTSTISSNLLKVPVVHGSGTAAQAMESGATAMTASELAVTFGTAFTAAPQCVCTHVNTTNTNACNIKSGSAPSTTAVTFAVASGGTDVVDWFCIGQR